jgi:hypothetical protein
MIIPLQEKVLIYRANGSVEEKQDFSTIVLSGEDVLPGFQLKLDLLLNS